jgi:predicted amidohydrolase
MRCTVLELAASWGEPARVLADIDARIGDGPATDLVLVPEAALHGYVSRERDFDLSRFAEPLDGATARECAAVARIRGVFVYRKRHPWLPETWATPGPERPPVVSIAGARVTITVCYDLQFIDEIEPELGAADVLLFPSAWVESPDTRREHLAEVARRFDVYIANANWAPGVVRVPGQGNSCVVAPDGTITTAAPLGRLDLDLGSR